VRQRIAKEGHPAQHHKAADHRADDAHQHGSQHSALQKRKAQGLKQQIKQFHCVCSSTSRRQQQAAVFGCDRQLFLTVSLITGTMVAVSGAIGFVGLMIPHMVRLLVGTDHRRVIPISLFVGGIFLIWVDVIARTAFDPVELPVGVITSLLGGPFFLWLLHQQLTQRGG
jgi:ABC-type cobalamin transport system permease subunit